MEDLTQGTADALVWPKKISHTSYVFMENYGNIVGKLWETHVNYDF